jgi:hypothetical protein
MASTLSESTKKQEDELMNVEALEFLEKATNKKNQNKLLTGISTSLTKHEKLARIFSNIIDHFIELKQYKKNKDGFYIVGDSLINKSELERVIANKYRTQILEKMRILESEIKDDVNITKIKLDISTNRQERIMLKETKKNIKSQWNQLSKHLNNQNRKLIDAVYKQGRIESAMRSQATQAMFQKDNISSKFMSIKHNFRMAMNKMTSQNIFNESRIHTAYQHRSMINHHNNTLNLKLLAAEQENADHQAKLELMRQRIKLLQKQLVENQALKDDMKESIRNMINMVQQAGQNLRDKTKQEQEQFVKDFQKLANEIGQGIKTAGKDFDRDVKQWMNDMIKQIEIDRELEKQLISLINKGIREGNDIDLDIWKSEKPVVDPTTKMPTSCGKNMPEGCLGRDWLENRNNFKNKQTGKQGIKIFRCDYAGGGAHYCASDGNVGFYWVIERQILYEPY